LSASNKFHLLRLFDHETSAVLFSITDNGKFCARSGEHLVRKFIEATIVPAQVSFEEGNQQKGANRP
jgi:hypothetical protein